MVASASPLPPAGLEAARRGLVDLARRLGADLVALGRDTAGGTGAPLSNHPAEGGTDHQDRTIAGGEALAAGELRRLVLRAIDKIDTGRPVPYGICELTGAPIEPDRLALMPWTPFATAGVERMEREGIPLADALAPA